MAFADFHAEAGAVDSRSIAAALTAVVADAMRPHIFVIPRSAMACRFELLR
jgi:hypothetical protein